MKREILKNVSVDCVIFGFDSEKLNVLLVDRELIDKKTNKKIFSDLTLTGYHIYEDEDLDTAATRILFNLTGLKNLFLEQFYTFGSLNRINRKNDQLWLEHNRDQGLGFEDRILTVGYYSLIDNTKVTIQALERTVKWYPVNNLRNVDLAYDHVDIVEKALERIRQKLYTAPIAFELLPDKFTLSQLQCLYEVILGKTFDKRNFRKKIAQMSFVVPLNEKKIGGAGKPAQLFMFSKDVYSKTRTDKLL